MKKSTLWNMAKLAFLGSLAGGVRAAHVNGSGTELSVADASPSALAYGGNAPPLLDPSAVSNATNHTTNGESSSSQTNYWWAPLAASCGVGVLTAAGALYKASDPHDYMGKPIDKKEFADMQAALQEYGGYDPDSGIDARRLREKLTILQDAGINTPQQLREIIATRRKTDIVREAAIDATRTFIAFSLGSACNESLFNFMGPAIQPFAAAAVGSFSSMMVDEALRRWRLEPLSGGATSGYPYRHNDLVHEGTEKLPYSYLSMATTVSDAIVRPLTENRWARGVSRTAAATFGYWFLGESKQAAREMQSDGTERILKTEYPDECLEKDLQFLTASPGKRWGRYAAKTAGALLVSLPAGAVTAFMTKRPTSRWIAQLPMAGFQAASKMLSSNHPLKMPLWLIGDQAQGLGLSYRKVVEHLIHNPYVFSTEAAARRRVNNGVDFMKRRLGMGRGTDRGATALEDAITEPVLSKTLDDDSKRNKEEVAIVVDAPESKAVSPSLVGPSQSRHNRSNSTSRPPSLTSTGKDVSNTR